MIWRHWSHLTQRPSVLTRFSPEVSSSTGSRLNHAMSVIRQCSRRSEWLSRRSWSVFDPALRLDAFGVSVLHFSHLGHRVRDLNDVGMSVAAGEDDVHHLRFLLQRCDYLLRVKHLVADCVVDLVEDDKIPVAGENLFFGFGPRFFDQADVLGIGYGAADLHEAAAHLLHNEVVAKGSYRVELAVVP